MRTREVDKYLFKNYLKKAEENFIIMREAYSKRLWNACVINAIHCAISSFDALTVFFKGVRHAGEKHEDALTLLQTIGIERETLKSKTKQFSALLSIKNVAEYEERLMDRKDASSAVKNAERIYLWVKGYLGK
jgi:HEPN domain-containing protein